MAEILINSGMLTENAVLLKEKEEGALLELSCKGGGLDMTWLKDREERYLTFTMEALADHSVPVNMLVYSSREKNEDPVFDIRFGVLPRIKTGICIDLTWLDAHALFPETCPGQLKIVCHGRRVEREEISRIVFATLPLDGEIQLELSSFTLTDTWPGEFPLPEVKLVDELGQNKRKEWTSKLHSVEEMKQLLRQQADEAENGYPYPDWSEYGGWKQKRLTEGSGFFTRCKDKNRWWLVDPMGYAFFSVGPDCVAARSDCRVDGMEKWMDWLPDHKDPIYGGMYEAHEKWPPIGEARRKCTLFSFEQANLYRAFGEEWYEKWRHMLPGQLKKYGMNTLGNWSDPRLLGTTGMPYVTSLPRFPETKQKIFRDFPDVFSEEYKKDALECAKALENRKEDPWMIGYFLRNEPAWAFVDNLVLADEVLYNTAQTVCKERLIETLKEKYITIAALNAAWGSGFDCFEDLYESQANVSKWSESSCKDMHEFSRRMLKEYVGIPSAACREVDPNHMNLGMRWAWISDPDVVTGWENFDVFSINCYAFDPTRAIQNVVDLGVELPVLIGEFHFGALDAGPSSTGLKGVASQRERGAAYSYYCQRAAAHPYGVGCHYFQCYDQFVLGRFDGENYNIGLFDICSQPYPEMMEAVKECGSILYEVAAGDRRPTEEEAVQTSMIAF